LIGIALFTFLFKAFYLSEHVSIDEKGNFYVVDRGNARIQVFAPVK